MLAHRGKGFLSCPVSYIFSSLSPFDLELQVEQTPPAFRVALFDASPDTESIRVVPPFVCLPPLVCLV